MSIVENGVVGANHIHFEANGGGTDFDSTWRRGVEKPN